MPDVVQLGRRPLNEIADDVPCMNELCVIKNEFSKIDWKSGSGIQS